MTRRTERVDELLRTEVSRLFVRLCAGSDTPLFSVTRVRVAPDMSVADVYVIPLDAATPPGQVLNKAKKLLPEMQRELAGVLTMFRTPRLRLRIDEGVRYEQHIEGLLRQAKIPPVEEGDVPPSVST